uniref:Uncharacterized protein n=2 Tax=Lygus hesperus TaxID=30085 RepID=A0A146KYH5_LYGHE
MSSTEPENGCGRTCGTGDNHSETKFDLSIFENQTTLDDIAIDTSRSRIRTMRLNKSTDASNSQQQLIKLWKQLQGKDGAGDSRTADISSSLDSTLQRWRSEANTPLWSEPKTTRVGGAGSEVPTVDRGMGLCTATDGRVSAPTGAVTTQVEKEL